MKSIWKYNNELPEAGKKIQFVVTPMVIEVDRFLGTDRLFAEKYLWSQIKIWRYLDGNE